MGWSNMCVTSFFFVKVKPTESGGACAALTILYTLRECDEFQTESVRPTPESGVVYLSAPACNACVKLP